ncbi:hypothetical protein KC351_g111 [Hortaea werneckii]|nr:hypothetical protein KC351_g111 [Hortaea werneckii]
MTSIQFATCKYRMYVHSMDGSRDFHRQFGCVQKRKNNRFFHLSSSYPYPQLSLNQHIVHLSEFLPRQQIPARKGSQTHNDPSLVPGKIPQAVQENLLHPHHRLLLLLVDSPSLMIQALLKFEPTFP